MTSQESIYLGKLKQIEELLRTAELDFKVLDRTLFLEHEEPKKRTTIRSMRLNDQKNKVAKDIERLAESLLKIQL